MGIIELPIKCDTCNHRETLLFMKDKTFKQAKQTLAQANWSESRHGIMECPQCNGKEEGGHKSPFERGMTIGDHIKKTRGQRRGKGGRR